MLWQIRIFYIGAILVIAAVVPVAAVSQARVPVMAVLASIAFGVVSVVLELMFPEMVLGVLLNIVGSTRLLVSTSVLSRLWRFLRWGAGCTTGTGRLRPVSGL